MPFCLLCEKTFSNDAMKPAKMKDHLERIHCDKKNKDLDFLRSLKRILQNDQFLKTFIKAPATVSYDGLKASYNIALNIAQKNQKEF